MDVLLRSFFFGFCPLMNWIGKADFSVCFNTGCWIRLPRISWFARTRPSGGGMARLVSIRIICGRRWSPWARSSVASRIIDQLSCASATKERMTCAF